MGMEAIKDVSKLLLRPRGPGDADYLRQEFILNLLLVFSVFLSFVSFFIITTRRLQFGLQYIGAHPLFAFGIFLTYLILYFLSRKGHVRVASYIFIVLPLIPAMYTSIEWGSLLPQAVLMYVLVIIMAGILISTRVAFMFGLILSLFVISLSYLQSKGYILFDLSWSDRIYSLSDSITASVTFLIIAFVTWLSNREIEQSLNRARKSEKDLKVERDLLEERVEERTAQLKKVQYEKMVHLYRFADFGRITSGVLHDIRDPLNTVMLNLEQLEAKGVGSESLYKVKEALGRAKIGTNMMEKYISAAQKQLRTQDSKEKFDMVEEIHTALHIMSSKGGQLGVRFDSKLPRKCFYIGNSVQFNQIITNLLSNAIDSYEDISDKEKVVTVILAKQGSSVILKVIDNGAGISSEDSMKVFDPFFTTKNIYTGTGIGLSITKGFVEGSFSGNITFNSKVGEGTTFFVKFPPTS